MLTLRIFLSLMLVWSGDSFCASPLRAYPASSSSMQLHASRSKDAMVRRNGSNKPPRQQGGPPKRVPNNKRTAIRWVIQGVERCLAVDEGGLGKKKDGRKNKEGGKSYNRRIDASLVDALYLVCDANSQKDILDAEKRVQVLMKNPKEFPVEVNERVMKAAAMAGLTSLSLNLLDSFLGDESNDSLPSPMAYTAILNALRKGGRVDRLEQTLADLASASRRVSRKTGESARVDIVAFNTYIAALCDAAVNELPFTSSSTVIEDDQIKGFNFTSLADNTAATSSSEKYLYKALNLLRGDTARTKFALEKDPDIYSYNSVLNAAAKCSKSGARDDQFTNAIMLSCLRGMKKRSIQPDTLTFNARIQAALATEGEGAAMRLIDQLLSDAGLQPDRYTINFLLKPFINAGRTNEIWTVLYDFHDKTIARNGKIVSSAFEAFLATIVDAGEVEFAREVFQSFFLTPRLMMTKEELGSKKEEPHNRLTPRTRHFNILLGGYSKAYQSTVSKQGKSAVQNITANTTQTSFDVGKAFELFEVMLGIGVPLDGYSVTSLMALPYASTDNVTSLLQRIEPEMMTDFNPAAYRSIISAYGKVADPSSAFWMFEEMMQLCRNSGRSAESWNTVLGALAKGCAGPAKDERLDILSSAAARARRNARSQTSASEHQFISLVDGKTCLDACMTILDTLRNRVVLPEGYKAPKPNSQTYCLVASALSECGTPELAMNLFRNAMKEGVAADGRFLNAVLRCYGDDIDGALSAWKSDIGPAAAAYEKLSNKRGTNVIAAYNGLMNVCGRALRPDIAVRISYAMNKAGVEPTEVTLNSYNAGKRVALEGNDSSKNLGLRNQYESLLQVECTKYNSRDKRRASDRKIRIIL